jgi:hypothetical protein
MERLLNEQETRVLGCLMEKAMATPEYYPLSLNALTPCLQPEIQPRSGGGLGHVDGSGGGRRP